MHSRSRHHSSSAGRRGSGRNNRFTVEEVPNYEPILFTTSPSGDTKAMLASAVHATPADHLAVIQQARH